MWFPAPAGSVNCDGGSGEVASEAGARDLLRTLSAQRNLAADDIRQVQAGERPTHTLRRLKEAFEHE
jgi:hypothetical protein